MQVDDAFDLLITAHHDQRRDAPLFHDVQRVDRQRVYVVGGSMGGTGTLSFAFRFPGLLLLALAFSLTQIPFMMKYMKGEPEVPPPPVD